MRMKLILTGSIALLSGIGSGYWSAQSHANRLNLPAQHAASELIPRPGSGVPQASPPVRKPRDSKSPQPNQFEPAQTRQLIPERLDVPNFASEALGAIAFGIQDAHLANNDILLGKASDSYVRLAWDGKRPESLQINLRDPVELNLIRVLFWEGDDRFYRYRLEISSDTIGPEWTTLVDCSGEQDQARSWQICAFKSQTVGRIRITGFYDSKSEGVRIVEVQAYKVSEAKSSEQRRSGF